MAVGSIHHLELRSTNREEREKGKTHIDILVNSLLRSVGILIIRDINSSLDRGI
jgi:hypothetical protein